MNLYNYGFMYNDIIIEDNLFTKKIKNICGKNKINKEIEL